jgi:hypothetical protein
MIENTFDKVVFFNRKIHQEQDLARNFGDSFGYKVNQIETVHLPALDHGSTQCEETLFEISPIRVPCPGTHFQIMFMVS